MFGINSVSINLRNLSAPPLVGNWGPPFAPVHLSFVGVRSRVRSVLVMPTTITSEMRPFRPEIRSYCSYEQCAHLRASCKERDSGACLLRILPASAPGWSYLLRVRSDPKSRIQNQTR